MALTKVLKLKARMLSPFTDKEALDVIRELQWQTAKASNAVMMACNLRLSEMFVTDFKPVESQKEFSKRTYLIAVDSAPFLRSDNAGKIQYDITGRYFGKSDGSYMKMVMKKTGNPPMMFKPDCPVPIKSGKDIKIEFGKNRQCTITLPVLSKNKWNEAHPDKQLKSGAFAFAIETGGNGHVLATLEKCVSGEYKVGASQITKSGKEVYIILTFSFEHAKADNLDKKRVLGVDLGIKYAAVCAVSDSDRKLFVPGEQIIQNCIRLENKRKKIQRETTYNGKDGHGRKHKTTSRRSAMKRQSNYHSLANRRFAKKIVDFAVDNGCGVINLEDLSGYGTSHSSDRFLGKWAYYQLQDFIGQKAAEHGISVKKIEPRYTSLTCSACGEAHIKSLNRPSQSEFICNNPKCTNYMKTVNADLNAARVIAHDMASKPVEYN